MTFATDIRLRRDPLDDRWVSEDGRVDIQHDHTFETWCDAPHPVRFSQREKDWYAGLDSFAKANLVQPYERSVALREGKKGYYCYGGCEHTYSMWVAAIDDERTEDVFETFGAACAEVERLTGQKVIAVPTRRERFVTVEDERGNRTWAVCGHRAERDINDNCYTCGGRI